MRTTEREKKEFQFTGPSTITPRTTNPLFAREDTATEMESSESENLSSWSCLMERPPSNSSMASKQIEARVLTFS